jgi:alpha-amylase/alpha-mannosidase (GH57 family)
VISPGHERGPDRHPLAGSQRGRAHGAHAEHAARRQKLICIHGHFYQPPRENPWLEAIERQDSAHPYHDWNERIAAECYAPNASSRILDPDGRILAITNNYERISFNFGPTLMAWLERRRPDVYEAVLEADRVSAMRFGGHGSALAQAYNHMILPLANRRDKATQVRWGIHDFELRFGRQPEGMWLPETAVDLETLEVLVDEGIAFTILAPHQAESIRTAGDESWTPFDEQRDTARPYRIPLPSGRSIAAFFYDGQLSRAVAFERLLHDGARFAERLVAAFDTKPGDCPLVHIATDGETYGHHHRHGDMALAFALRELEGRSDIRLTNYGEYLELNPPGWEAQIRENTSWSCVHGIDRWRADCGCSGGGGPGWRQAWRAPLREALDWLRDEMAPHFEWEGGKHLRDPWEARDAYLNVILDRSDASLGRFFAQQSLRLLTDEERRRALRLLEIERHALLMFTSCGWFFDDISGIETTQVLLYAARAIQLARESYGAEHLEEAFLDRIGAAHSNLPEWGDGRMVYHRVVAPARVDRGKAGAHYAVSSVFEEQPEEETIYCFHFVRRDQRREEAAGATLIAGRLEVTSLITRACDDLCYAVLHLDHHNLVGGVREWVGPDTFEVLVRDLTAPFLRTDFANVIRVMDREFEASTYSLRSLFAEAQRRIVDRILQTSIEEAETAFAKIYEDRAPLLRFLADLGAARPRPFMVAAEYVINMKLRRILEQPEPQLQAVHATLAEAAATGITIDAPGAAFVAQRALERQVARVMESPRDLRRIERVTEMTRLLEGSLPVNLWTAQNRYFDLLRELEPDPRAKSPDEARWADAFIRLGEALHIAPPASRNGG